MRRRARGCRIPPDERAAARAHLERGAIGCHTRDRVGERLHAAHRGHHTGDARLDDVGDAALDAAHNGHDTGGHRLEQRHRKTFRPRRQHELVVVREARGRVGVRERAGELHAGRARPGGAHRGILRTAADDRPRAIDAARAERAVDCRQIEDAFEQVEAADEGEPAQKMEIGWL